jgi:transposase
VSDLFGKAGREFLATLELREPPRRRLDSLMALICDFDREIAQTTREIDGRAKHDDRVPLLCQIRGVGPYTAMLIIAEVGEIERFPTARTLCAWAGLTPTVRSSDGKVRLGRISRMGSCAVRWALVEAAQKSVLGGGPLRKRFERIAKRRGRNVAKVAVAGQIVTLCYYGLRDGEIRCLQPGRRARVEPWRPSHDRRRGFDCPTRSGTGERATRASSLKVMASLTQDGRRLD